MNQHESVFMFIRDVHSSVASVKNDIAIVGGVMDNITLADDVPSTRTLGGSLHCSHGALLGPLGLIVQGSLAFLAFCSLIVKRFCEPKPERRPWKIWFFDTSKQAIGAAVIHFANVFLADMFQGDPCTWYIVSFLLDSTVGLLVIYIGLKIAQCIGEKNDMKTLNFGEYGSPAQCNAWMGQCGVYILVMVIEKILMTLLVQFHFWKKVRYFIMYPIKDPKVELIIVMFVVPLIVNAFIFWVVDNFLMRKARRKKLQTQVTPLDSTSVKYTKATDRVRYYDRTEKADESDLDVLLSQDEESDHQYKNSSNRSLDSGSSQRDQYSLITDT